MLRPAGLGGASGVSGLLATVIVTFAFPVFEPVIPAVVRPTVELAFEPVMPTLVAPMVTPIEDERAKGQVRGGGKAQHHRSTDQANTHGASLRGLGFAGLGVVLGRFGFDGRGVRIPGLSRHGGHDPGGNQ